MIFIYNAAITGNNNDKVLLHSALCIPQKKHSSQRFTFPKHMNKKLYSLSLWVTHTSVMQGSMKTLNHDFRNRIKIKKVVNKKILHKCHMYKLYVTCGYCRYWCMSRYINFIIIIIIISLISQMSWSYPHIMYATHP